MAVPPLGRVDQRLYVYILISQAVIVLALEAGTLAYAQTHVDLMSRQPLRAIICHFIFLAMIHMSQVGLSVEAIWKNHSLQIYWTIIMQLLLIPISSTQIFETRDAVKSALCEGASTCVEFHQWWRVIRPMQLTITVVHGLIFPLQLVFGAIVGQSLGWEWAFVSRMGLQSYMVVYRSYQLFAKFGFILISSITAQLLVLGYDHGAVLLGLSIAGLAVAASIILSGHIATTYESRWLMLFMLTLIPILQAYLFWRFSEFFIPKSKHLYYNTRVSLSLQIFIATFLQAESFYLGLLTQYAYGITGLKEAKLGKVDPAGKRGWRVGQTTSSVLKKPPGTDHHPHYYAEGEEMKERASIV